MEQRTKAERKVFCIQNQGETVQEAWVKESGIHCPRCGDTHVWKKDNGFNKNIAKLCTNCGYHFTLASLDGPGDFHKTEQRVKFIETGKTGA